MNLRERLWTQARDQIMIRLKEKYSLRSKLKNKKK